MITNIDIGIFEQFSEVKKLSYHAKRALFDYMEHLQDSRPEPMAQAEPLCPNEYAIASTEYAGMGELIDAYGGGIDDIEGLTIINIDNSNGVIVINL